LKEHFADDPGRRRQVTLLTDVAARPEMLDADRLRQ
jgi:hypothetical protein